MFATSQTIGRPIHCWLAVSMSLLILACTASVVAQQDSDPKLKFHSVESKNSVTDISPDGKVVAMLGRDSLQLIDSATGEVLDDSAKEIKFTGRLVKYSPSGKHLVCQSKFGELNFFEISDGGKKLVPLRSIKNAGDAVSFARDVPEVAYLSRYKLTVYDYLADEIRHEIERKDFPFAGTKAQTALSAKGGQVLVIGSDAVALVDVESGKIIQRLGKRSIRDARLNPARTHLVNRSLREGEVIELQTGKIETFNSNRVMKADFGRSNDQIIVLTRKELKVLKLGQSNPQLQIPIPEEMQGRCKLNVSENGTHALITFEFRETKIAVVELPDP